MYLLTPATAERYLRERGELEPDETIRVTELSGGVSNEVLLVERWRGDRFVLKQAREQLRVKDEWKCDVRRIWREIDVLRLCGEILRESNIGAEMGMTATVPDILFEDCDNYCYAMTAAPPEHVTWKQQLLGGNVDERMGVVVGQLLGVLHASTWKSQNAAALLDDRSYFDALRIDPYYRRIAEVHPALRDQIQELIDSALSIQLALTHGDFSPKNLLISTRQIMLIDFEVGHFGDPAFDNGFCLSHLMLKGLAAGFAGDGFRVLAQALWKAYAGVVQSVSTKAEWQALGERTILNLAACLLARVDGKSQVDYLNADQRSNARSLAFTLFRDRPTEVEHAVAYLGTYDPW